MIVALIIFSIIVVFFYLRRRAKRGLVAGLVSERPAFHITPPTRRIGKLKDGRL